MDDNEHHGTMDMTVKEAVDDKGVAEGEDVCPGMEISLASAVGHVGLG